MLLLAAIKDAKGAVQAARICLAAGPHSPPSIRLQALL